MKKKSSGSNKKEQLKGTMHDPVTAAIKLASASTLATLKLMKKNNMSLQQVVKHFKDEDKKINPENYS